MANQTLFRPTKYKNNATIQNNKIILNNKNFITNSYNANLILVTKTDIHKAKYYFYYFVKNTEKFKLGKRNLKKLELKAQILQIYFEITITSQKMQTQLMNELPQERLLLAVTLKISAAAPPPPPELYTRRATAKKNNGTQNANLFFET